MVRTAWSRSARAATRCLRPLIVGLPLVIAPGLAGAGLSSAAAAGRAVYVTPGYSGTSKTVATRPATPPSPMTLSSSGRFPDLLVDTGGTAHIVWVTSDGVGADAVHYCRLPRGARSCSSTQTLVPQKAYGPGDDPSYNTSSDGPRIVQVGQQLVILDRRYPTAYPKPDGSSDSDTVLEWVSEDGGTTFTGPGLVGTQPIGGGVVGYGPATDPRILTVTAGVTGGTYVQELTPGQFTSQSADLGALGPDEAYSGSLALDAGLPVAAFADLGNHTLVRRWTGTGSAADASTWGPALTVPGDEPKLAGGPGGLFMMNRPATNGPYAVRRLTGGTAGTPLPVSDAADPQYRAFTETSSGGLVAGWESRGGAAPGVSIRASRDGTGWSAPLPIIGGMANGQLALGAAGDGGGFAVLNHTGGVNGPGEIVTTAYGTAKPTGVPGLAGIPGGGDPTASTSCQRVAFGAVEITGELGCLLHGSGSHANDVVSDGELDFNGLRIIPDPNVQIIVDPHGHTIDTSGKVRVLAEGSGLSVTLWHGEIHVRLPTAGSETDLFNFDMSQFAADLDGFPIDARVDVKLTATGVRIPVDLKLPAVFGGVTGHAELVADPQHGLHVGDLSIAISSAPIGPLLADFAISFDSAHDVWLGSGKLRFPPQPAGLELAADVAFADGHFTRGGIDIKPPGFGLPVFTDVYVDDIHGSLQLEPKTVVTAGVGIGVIPVGTPTNFVNTMQIDGDLALTLADPFRIDVTGHAQLLGIPIADAHLLFVSNGYVSLDGQFAFEFAPIRISAGLDAVVDLPHKLFSAEFKADFEVLDYTLSSVDGIVSSSGLAVCGDLPVPPFSRVTVGHHWNHDYTDLVPSLDLLRSKSCDLSGYRVAAAPTRARAAATGLAVSLPRADTVDVAVHGVGGAPAVALVAPDGTRTVPAVGTIADAATKLTAPGGPAAAAFTVTADDTTVVVLRHPAAGTWRIESLPGSAPLLAVAESHTLPGAGVTGRVSGHGRRLQVRYRLHQRPGMTVQLAEVAGRVLHVLGTASGSSGTLAFTPADGPAGSRRIVALVTQDGLPRPRVPLGRFVAPGPVRPGRPGRPQLVVRGRSLKIRFAPARDARGYRVSVSCTDGKRRLIVVSGSRRAATVADLGPRAKATVTVTGYSAAGVPGVASVASVVRGS